MVTLPRPSVEYDATNEAQTRAQIVAAFGNVPPLIVPFYTVATLPKGSKGLRAFVTDAAGPTFLTAPTGGGAVFAPVLFNGTAWVVG